MNNDEHQYLQLISNILVNGDDFEGRNGNTKMIFGTQMRFQLSHHTLPLLTTKKLAWKTCLKELLWFICGSTNNKTLKEQNVHIWDTNGSKDFLNSRGLDYKEDDLGPVYGHQWRFFNASYVDCHSDYKGLGVDQLQNVIQMLKHPTEKYSRRIILSAWAPCHLDLMALPPCHILMHFHVNQQDELSCILYQRSGDVGLGIPFNIASYAYLTHLLAHHCDLKAKEFIHFIGNAHIYHDHIEPLKTQLNRTPYAFPSLKITNKYDNINDYKLEDFVVENYNSYDKITMQMSA